MAGHIGESELIQERKAGFQKVETQLTIIFSRQPGDDYQAYNYEQSERWGNTSPKLGGVAKAAFEFCRPKRYTTGSYGVVLDFD